MYDPSAPGQPVLVLDDEGDVENRYLWGPQVDQLLAQEDAANDVLWALGDHQNTVRDWVEYDSGATSVADHAQYDAFGNRLDTPTVDSLFAWTGRFRDPDTGLQYNHHRWYDPVVGRWLSEDPAGTPPENLYVYGMNSPTDRVDPSGLLSCKWPSTPVPDGANGCWVQGVPVLPPIQLPGVPFPTPPVWIPWNKKTIGACFAAPPACNKTQFQCQEGCRACAKAAQKLGMQPGTPEYIAIAKSLEVCLAKCSEKPRGNT